MEKNNVSKSLVKSASIVIVVTVIAKLLGFVREMVMGRVFGTGMDSNIYFWALGITTSIFLAIATAIASAMLPTLNEYRIACNKDKMKTYINKIISIGLLVSMLVITIMVLTAPSYVALIARSYTGESLQKAILIVQLLVPSVLFIVLAYITKTILQANEKFFMYAIVSLPYNIFVVLYLLFFADRYKIYGLAIATVIGWSLQLIIQIPTLLKLKTSFKLDFNFNDEDIKRFGILIIPLLMSALIYSVNTLIDKSLAINLSEGKVAGLTYGYTVYSSIVTTIIIGITSVLYPKFVESKVKNTKEKFREEVISVLNIMIYIGMPLMAALIIFSKPFVEVAYMDGSFDSYSVELTKNSLIFYSIAAAGYAMQEILFKVYYSLKESKIPMITSIVSVLINITLNLIFVRYMDYIGLALATSIAVITNAIMLLLCLQSKIGRVKKRLLFLTVAKTMIALTPTVLVSKYLLDILYKTDASRIISLAIFMLVAIIAGIIYLGVTFILKMPETKFIIENYLGIFSKIGGKKNEKR